MKGDGVLIAGALGAGLAVLVADHLTTPYDLFFDSYAKTENVPGNLLRALARVESSFRADAVSPGDDRGLLQLSPSTRRAFGLSDVQALDPESNVAVGARLLASNTIVLQNRGVYSDLALAASWNVGVDLKPRDVGIAYGSRVLWHWRLYDLGRAFA